ncbi:MAG TPA: transporter substrate-binding domain-containing protein, partial [Burkholderiales bacterium]
AEPQRANEIAFTNAYLEIPVTFLVPAGSKVRSIADVDREGVRISVSARSAYDLYLSRTLKHAKLLRVEGIDASYEQFKKDGLEVLAGLKPRLVSDAEKLPGSRVLDGQVTGVQQAVGVPKKHASAAKFTREFVDEIKRSGLVAKTIEKHGVKGVTVAP